MEIKNLFNRYVKNNIYVTACFNFFVVMVLFMLCRIAFYLFNTQYFPGMTLSHLLSLCMGGIQFDLSALLYTNLLYFILMAIPFQFRYLNGYQKTAKWIFIITNSIVIIANCIDIVYFKFINRRTTSSVFSEFANEHNIAKIMADGFIQYWYVSLFGLLIIFGLYKLYYKPQPKKQEGGKIYFYYLRNIIALLLIAVFTVSGIRGGLGHYVRPITLSNANKYVDKPIEAFIVLNTPFSIMRTLGKDQYVDPQYFKTEKELKAEYDPIIYPHPNGQFKRLNVVIFIIESFSKEYIGELNKDLDGGKYKGHTPFVDSLLRNSLTFEYTFANGHRSIEAMPSVLSSIPSFIEPYILTGYSSNKTSGIAGELDKKGYYTAFFHGAPNGSMGFDAFAHISGFKSYYGMTEYNNDADFDGTWAIWDEPFFQFFAKKMNTFKQPFMTALFSASSHHPFVVPKKYENRFKDADPDYPIYKCVEYTDYSLQRFFEAASKMPWYKNTLFVITADHTNQMKHPEYLTDAGRYKVPILFYYPGGNLKGRLKKIAQQADIMPTVLGYLNYDKPYVAFGHDLLDSTREENMAMLYDKPVYEYFKGKYLYQFDGQNIIAVYDFINDVMLKKNLKNSVNYSEAEKNMKAHIQQYITRMKKNELTVN